MLRLLFLLTIAFAVNIYASTTINSGASFNVGFSPDGNSLMLILQSIDRAKKSIHIAAYSFTSKPIAQALLNASRRGVDVKIIADEKSNSNKYSEIGRAHV